MSSDRFVWRMIGKKTSERAIYAVISEQLFFFADFLADVFFYAFHIGLRHCLQHWKSLGNGWCCAVVFPECWSVLVPSMARFLRDVFHDMVETCGLLYPTIHIDLTAQNQRAQCNRNTICQYNGILFCQYGISQLDNRTGQQKRKHCKRNVFCWSCDPNLMDLR